MNVLRVAGSPESALAHLSLVGLAAILTDHGATGVRFWWEDGPELGGVLQSRLGPLDVAEVVLSHALQYVRRDSWVQALTTHEGTSVGLFSPRIKAPSSVESWEALSRTRAEWLDRKLTPLDRRLIGALGEPASWLMTGKDDQPDQGASRWEMKTRNRGEDFIQHRLAPLAQAVAERSSQGVLDGLTGKSCRDEVGKEKGDSRTPTGLTTPRRTDNALAWCAMWGISHTWLTPQTRLMSQTAGTFPRNRVHPHRYALPVFTNPTGLAKWGWVAASQAFDQVAFHDNDVASTRWLSEQGVAAIIEFVARQAGSSSAPERLLMDGNLRVLEHLR